MPITVEQRLPVPQSEQKSSVSIRNGVPLWLYCFLFFALILLCLLQFHSWISIEQGASPDAKNLMAPLYVVNEGYLSVLNVTVHCEYRTSKGNYIVPDLKVAQTFTFKQRQLLPCSANSADNSRSHGSTAFTVTVDYRVAWLPLYRSQTFRFKSATLADGTYLWAQE